MDADLNIRLAYELKNLKNTRDQYTRRLELCRGFESVRLKKLTRKNGKSYYYEKRRKTDKYVYLGTKGVPDVKRICEAHFLKEALKRIDFNIELISHVLQEYLSIDKYAVNESLPLAYRTDVPPVSDAYLAEGNKWKSSRLAFQSEFPENYPEHKTERTSDGVMVKTVSEVVLYERFKSEGFAQLYELPLVLTDYGPAMYPDFTILSPVDMKTEIIVEYIGRLDLPKYRDDFAYRLGRYIANGYKPGVDLFFVFSDKTGHIDSMQINRIIADIKGI